MASAAEVDVEAGDQSVRFYAKGGFFKDNEAAVDAVHGLLAKYIHHPATQRTCSIVLRLDDRVTHEKTYEGQCILVRGIPKCETPQLVWDASVLGPPELWPEHLYDAKEPYERTVLPLSMYTWNPPLSAEAMYAASFQMYDLRTSTKVNLVYTDKDGAKRAHALVPTSKHTPENNPGNFPPHIWSAIDSEMSIELESNDYPLFK